MHTVLGSRVVEHKNLSEEERRKIANEFHKGLVETINKASDAGMPARLVVAYIMDAVRPIVFEPGLLDGYIHLVAENEATGERFGEDAMEGYTPVVGGHSRTLN